MEPRLAYCRGKQQSRSSAALNLCKPLGIRLSLLPFLQSYWHRWGGRTLKGWGDGQFEPAPYPSPHCCRQTYLASPKGCAGPAHLLHRSRRGDAILLQLRQDCGAVNEISHVFLVLQIPALVVGSIHPHWRYVPYIVMIGNDCALIGRGINLFWPH